MLIVFVLPASHVVGEMPSTLRRTSGPGRRRRGCARSGRGTRRPSTGTTMSRRVARAVNTGLIPSFCSTELSWPRTHEPSVVTPIAWRKNVRVPDAEFGITGTTACGARAADLVPRDRAGLAGAEDAGVAAVDRLELQRGQVRRRVRRLAGLAVGRPGHRVDRERDEQDAGRVGRWPARACCARSRCRSACCHRSGARSPRARRCRRWHRSRGSGRCRQRRSRSSPGSSRCPARRSCTAGARCARWPRCSRSDSWSSSRSVTWAPTPTMSVWPGITPVGGSACAEPPTATAPATTAARPLATNALWMLRTLVLLSKGNAAPQRGNSPAPDVAVRSLSAVGEP